jgi:hypothetical protein
MLLRKTPAGLFRNSKGSIQEDFMNKFSGCVRLFGGIALAAIIFALPPVSLAQEGAPFLGDWKGTISIAEIVLDIQIHFTLNKEKKLTGTIDVISQGGQGIALGDFKIENRKISFTINDPGAPGDPRFAGTLDEAGTTLAGTFTQSGLEGTFSVKK